MAAPTNRAGDDQGADGHPGAVAGIVLAGSDLPVMVVPGAPVDMAAVHSRVGAPARV